MASVGNWPLLIDNRPLRVALGGNRRLANACSPVTFRDVKELVFEVTQEGDGGYVAEALGESIITEADTWAELRANVREAVRAFYFDRPAPTSIRLRLIRDEILV